MGTLSLCMIVKNEVDTLRRCLESVQSAIDEIVVVDTGSTDGTVESAFDAGARVEHFLWIDDFSAARNYAFSFATSDYIMWLDADDILKPNDLIKLIAFKNQLDGTVRMAAAKYDVTFNELGQPIFSYYRERIFLRKAKFRWEGRVHETIALDKDVIYADFAVTHAKKKPIESGRNLRILERELTETGGLSPRQKYYFARELYYNGRETEAEQHLSEFIAGAGWTEDKICACSMLCRCRLKRGDEEGGVRALFESFRFDVPRAEICCQIGDVFLAQKNYRTAVYWYNSALRPVPNGKNGSFVQSEYCNYIPFLQLCVCYDRLGKYELAEFFNEQAATIRPKNKAVESNRAYFLSRAEQNLNK